jgi:two-component system phosphate regulon sensor histidine kinase PhoR
MLSSRFSRKLLASYVLLLLLAAGVIGVLVDARTEKALNGQLEQTLKNHARMLEPYAELVFAAGADERMGNEITRTGNAAGIRITLIGPDGTVLADSEQSPSLMENHGSRPEVLQAMDQPFGVERRYSQTVKYWMLYVAKTLRTERGVLGTVRVSMPLREVDQLLGSMRDTVLFGGVAGLLVALLLGFVVARRITAPITDMIRVAERLRAGEYEHRVRRLPEDEIGLLGDTLNRLGDEVAHQLAELGKERSELQAIIAGMVEGVLAVDENEVVLLCNEAAREMLGVPDLKERGRPLWEQVRVAGLTDLIARAKAEGEPVRQDIEIWREGRETILAAHAAAYGTPETRGVVVVLHNITERRHLEQMRRDFVANVSHELKTPLTAIKGYLETLLEGGIDDPQVNRRFLEKMGQNVSRLNALVADVLNLARIESGKGVLKSVQVDWTAAAREAIKRYETAAASKKIDVQADFPDEPIEVLGDPEGITQIVENLLDNAIKYTPESGRVRLRLRKGNGMVSLEIEDTGIGIPQKHLGRIFERFYRVDKARSRELGGTGLGLSIVKHLAAQMNGTVAVESEEGKGSCFSVTLPLAAPA